MLTTFKATDCDGTSSDATPQIIPSLIGTLLVFAHAATLYESPHYKQHTLPQDNHPPKHAMVQECPTQCSVPHEAAQQARKDRMK